MCTTLRLSITTLAAAAIFTLAPLAAQAKNAPHSGSMSHTNGNQSHKSSGKSGTVAHTVPFNKTSHDSSKLHKDFHYASHEHSSHMKTGKDFDRHSKDHDRFCKDHDHYCKDHDHHCKDHCHDHDWCHDHDRCHDWCYNWCRPCWSCGFGCDFPCFDSCWFGGCDLDCFPVFGGCEDACPVVGGCDDHCDSDNVIIINNNPCDSDDNVVIDQ
jgi:hypothetical protein